MRYSYITIQLRFLGYENFNIYFLGKHAPTFIKRDSIANLLIISAES